MRSDGHAVRDAHWTRTMDILRDNPLLTLFLIIASGLLIGAVRIGKFSFGASGVIFSSILFGLLGCTIPASADKVGLVLFLYAVGISAGHGFFRLFAAQGARIAELGLLITATGAAIAGSLAYIWEIPPSLATGIFAGALTSTPALAAALDVAADPGAVSVGYGLAYPFGVIGVVLFVQTLPRLLRIDMSAQTRKQRPSAPPIVRVLAEVKNPTLFGRKVMDVHFIRTGHCRVLRYLEGEQLVPVTPETTLHDGMHVLVIGDEESVIDAIDFLGKRSDHCFYIDSDTHKKVVVTSANMSGKKMGELDLFPRFGITVSRVSRYGVEFIPADDTVFQAADVVTVVGPRDNILRFQEFAGHRRRILNETDLIAVSVGIGGGLLLGMIHIPLPGTREGFTLGLAGGPLIAGLVMAHFGKIGRIRGYIPPAARHMMMNLGLVFFLAGAGIKAGARLPEIIGTHGGVIVPMALIVVLVPMAVGYIAARRLLGLNVLQALGGITGGMTSTPGLGALNDSVDSEVPAMSYAAAYPVALIFMTIFAQAIIRIIESV